jgi:sugar-specific transcriptional regulator TrmB
LDSDEKNIQVLKDLGLSISQGRVYIALLKLGPDSKATSISKFSKVPRQDIYRVLEELEQVGVVEKTISRPVKFYAIPIKKATSLLLGRKKDNLLKLEKDADALSGRLCENLLDTPVFFKKDRFIVISERESIICKALEQIGTSRKRVWMITPWSEVMMSLEFALEVLIEACNRGVDVRWITDEPQEYPPLPKVLQKLPKNPSFRFRLSPNLPTVKLGIYDDIIALALFPDNSSSLSPGLCSNNLAFLAITETYFETYWKSGKDIDRWKGKTSEAQHRSKSSILQTSI